MFRVRCHLCIEWNPFRVVTETPLLNFQPEGGKKEKKGKDDKKEKNDKEDKKEKKDKDVSLPVLPHGT